MSRHEPGGGWWLRRWLVAPAGSSQP